jgi:hypothetical protein
MEQVGDRHLPRHRLLRQAVEKFRDGVQFDRLLQHGGVSISVDVVNAT